MDRAKRYLLANFEHLFVLVALLSTAGVDYLVPTKLAFLHFYFLLVQRELDLTAANETLVTSTAT